MFFWCNTIEQLEDELKLRVDLLVMLHVDIINIILCTERADLFLSTDQNTLFFQVLYNLRPQVITASDLEDTAYVKRRHALKSTRHVTSLFHWFVVLAFTGGVYYLMRRRTITFPTFKVFS